MRIGYQYFTYITYIISTIINSRFVHFNFNFSFKFLDNPYGTVKIKQEFKQEFVNADEHVIELKFRVKLPDSAVDRERVKRHILENGILVLRRIDHQ